jgi:hypothetical protein
MPQTAGVVDQRRIEAAGYYPFLQMEKIVSDSI